VTSFLTFGAWAGSPDLRKAERARKTQVSAALLKGYKVLASAVRNYPENRKCFSCHHQTLPLLAFSLRDSNLPRSIEFTNSVGTRGIVDFTTSSFETKRPQLIDGSKIDGGALAVGYGLWTMVIARVKPNETTHAMVQYQVQVRSALKRAMKWSPTVEKPIDHEDLVGLLWLRYQVRNSVGMGDMDGMGMGMMGMGMVESGMGGMGMGGMGMGGMHDAVSLDLLLRYSQREDGGWGQASDLPSDAYATGMSLLIDDQTSSRYKGRTGLSWAARDEAVDFLLRTQEEDGSWHVESRSTPIRTFFDNGDPHGKDRFISVMATSWAVAALASYRGNHREPMDESRREPMIRKSKSKDNISSTFK